MREVDVLRSDDEDDIGASDAPARRRERAVGAELGGQPVLPPEEGVGLGLEGLEGVDGAGGALGGWAGGRPVGVQGDDVPGPPRPSRQGWA